MFNMNNKFTLFLSYLHVLTMCLLSDGSELQWVDNVRYLGVCVTRFTHFSCSFDNAKKSFTGALMQSSAK